MYKVMSATLTEILRKLGLYLRAKLVIALVMSVLTYLGLRLIGVEYSAPLALMTGFLDLIPVVGPLLALVVSAGVALATGNFTKALLVVLFYLLLQQVEAWILEPRLLGGAVGLNPWLTLAALVLASIFFGPLGALLAIPALIVVTVIYTQTKK